MDRLKALTTILESLEVVNYDNEITELKVCDKKARELLEKLLRNQSEIQQIKKETEKLMLKEPELHQTIRSNAEEIVTLKANLQIQQSIVDTLPEVLKECTCWSDYTQEKDLTTTVCNNLMQHFGFEVEVEHIEADAWRSKFTFPKGEDILLDFDIVEKTFYLQSMTPIHPNFDHLQTYLYETQDVSGFMYHARKYFLSIR